MSISRFLSITLLSISAALVSVTPAGAQAYPTKPIRIVVPFGAGDLADTIARMLGSKMATELGQPVVIENRPGASGLIGLQAALQSDADGHTLVMGQMGGMAVAPNINRFNFDIRAEFEPVALTYTNYMLLVANPSLPADTLPELIEYSKANPEKVQLGTNGEGGFPHLAMELLKEKTGFSFTHVTYKGSAQIPADVIAGHVDMTVLGFSTLYPHVESGRVKPIAVTGEERPSIAPGIPTVKETVPGYSALGWFGFFVRQGTPAEIVDKLNTTVNDAMNMPDIVERAKALGLDAAAGSPEDFERVWQQDFEKWGKLIQDLGLAPK